MQMYKLLCLAPVCVHFVVTGHNWHHTYYYHYYYYYYCYFN